MKLTINFRALAKAEYDTAVAWYDQARPNLGYDFEAEVQDRLDEASTIPQRYPISDGDIREAPLRCFDSYAYYCVRSSRLIVVAIYHQPRALSGWHGRT